MSMRSGSFNSGGVRRESGTASSSAGGGAGGMLLDEQEMMEDHLLADDDNPDAGGGGDARMDEEGVGGEGGEGAIAGEGEAEQREDPLVAAIDDMEGRVVEALDELKQHSGVRTQTALYNSLHDELATQLKPVIEIAAHTGPSVARTYGHHGTSAEDLEHTMEDVYDRVISDLVLPVILEIAQSDQSPAKRSTCLEFFHHFYKECLKAGSWLDTTTNKALQAGPYGPGGGRSHHHDKHQQQQQQQQAQQLQQITRRRNAKRLAREGEILRYWIQASIATTQTGVFTNEEADGAVASRGIIAASAALKPSLRHICQRIKDADDRGAARLYAPTMKMIESVIKRLLVQGAESARAASIKFLEIVIMCCTRKGMDAAQANLNQRRRGQSSPEDFSLDDLPEGHPIITHEALESVAEYAFTTLRGLTLMGGQVKIDVNLLSDMMFSAVGSENATPSAQVVSVLKPAALAFLEIMSGVATKETVALTPAEKKEKKKDNDSSNKDQQTKEQDKLILEMDRSAIEYDFVLSQKSYSLTINAMSVLAANRPVFFKEAAICLARRSVARPAENGGLTTKASVLAITSHLKATCLTLLRNALSITTGASLILKRALVECDMEIQAEKALSMAKQTTALKTAGRAARNRANMYYEWDQTTSSAAGGAGTDRLSKRQRETDDALAKLKAARASRGLGHGIQLPASMSDAVELIMINLVHLPTERPPTASSKSTKKGSAKKSTSASPTATTKMTLDLLVDAVMTNGASLSQEEGRWYDRDGGAAWEVSLETNEKENDGSSRYQLDAKFWETIELWQQHQTDSTAASTSTKDEVSDPETKRRKLFHDQCQRAASDAMNRIVTSSHSATTRSKSLANLGSQLVARLAFTLEKVQPAQEQQPALSMARDSITSVVSKVSAADMNQEQQKHITKESLIEFIDSYPLAAAGLVHEATTASSKTNSKDGFGSGGDNTNSLVEKLLNEAFLQSSCLRADNTKSVDSSEKEDGTTANLYKQYDQALDLFIASTVHAGELSNEKPNDSDKKKAAAQSAAILQSDIAKLPRLTSTSLTLICAMCDIEEITKRAMEVSKKEASQDSIAVAAATHAAKVAAEKRATSALQILRDTAFQRDDVEIRKEAVNCAVGIAAGRSPASPNTQDKALKLTMNVLFARNEVLQNCVLECATGELERASAYAIEKHKDIQSANAAAEAAEKQGNDDTNNASMKNRNPLAPRSEDEKQAMERMKKPALLYMALCVRRPEIIQTLFELSCQDNADVLAKAVRVNMSKLSRAVAQKFGAATIALKVAEMISAQEAPMLLSFLENLTTSGAVDKNSDGEDELIDACFKIYDTKVDARGKKDLRYLIPVVCIMKRAKLVERLPDFVAADDNIFLAALEHMGERVVRQALLFRDEPDEENPTLCGMTLCEQLVFLHKVDFSTAKIPQKRYLAAIKLCLDDEAVYNDRVLMSALDYLSGRFLTGAEKLPLAFMRTCILVCTKHESLHPWICTVLLPRLVEGQIYSDPRQWEGWMRCAHMLEDSSETGVSATEAIQKLPAEQLQQYKKKWKKK